MDDRLKHQLDLRFGDSPHLEEVVRQIEDLDDFIKELSPELPQDEIDRILYATLYLSKSDRSLLDAYVQGTKEDWRDTLIEAGLAGSNWHEVMASRGY